MRKESKVNTEESHQTTKEQKNTGLERKDQNSMTDLKWQ